MWAKHHPRELQHFIETGNFDLPGQRGGVAPYNAAVMAKIAEHWKFSNGEPR